MQDLWGPQFVFGDGVHVGARDGLGQHLVVGGLDELVDQLRGQGVNERRVDVGVASKSNARNDLSLGNPAARMRTVYRDVVLGRVVAQVGARISADQPCTGP